LETQPEFEEPCGVFKERFLLTMKTSFFNSFFCEEKKNSTRFSFSLLSYQRVIDGVKK